MKIGLLLAVIALGAGQPTHEDFLKLQSSLKEFIASGEVRLPSLVRMSFHDLIDYDPATGQPGGAGCIMAQSVLEFPEDFGLSDDTVALKDWVTSHFPTTHFTYGDVVSLTGKTAIEAVYPCIQVKWRYGRTACEDSSLKPEGPSGKIDTIAKYKPFLDRYGLTANELAILIAGTHGIAQSRAVVKESGFGNFDFAEVTSGKDWIAGSLSNAWKFFEGAPGFVWYIADTTRGIVGRLPSDLVFFPKAIEKSANGTVDRSALPNEVYLSRYVEHDRSEFDREFARILAKMFEIGVAKENLVEFKEPHVRGLCLPEQGATQAPSTQSDRKLADEASHAESEYLRGRSTSRVNDSAESNSGSYLFLIYKYIFN